MQDSKVEDHSTERVCWVVLADCKHAVVNQQGEMHQPQQRSRCTWQVSFCLFLSARTSLVNNVRRSTSRVYRVGIKCW